MNTYHYFASCAFGWATAPTRKEAVEKLGRFFSTDLKRVVNHAQKSGKPGAYLWSCRVEGDHDSTDYDIEFFQPKGVKTDNGRDHCFVKVTQKQVLYADWPSQEDHDHLLGLSDFEREALNAFATEYLINTAGGSDYNEEESKLRGFAFELINSSPAC